MGNILLTATIEGMKNLKDKIERYRTDVELVISGLERFKLVMNTISEIKRLCIQAEVDYSQYQVLCSHLSK